MALGNAVFLWNAENGTITHLMDLATEGEYFTSLAWVEEGPVLAVGISTGVVQVVTKVIQMNFYFKNQSKYWTE